MKEFVFTFVAPFGGSGLGARGFLDAAIQLPNLGVSARWECLGGVDIDPLACADFAYLTGVEQLCADIQALTPADLRRHYGARAPDCVFTSSPCQGASGLLSAAKAKTAKYQALNELSLVWARLMIAAWDEPPKLLVFENVPRLPSRAPRMLRELKAMLRRAGYVVTEGFHDCGELGGLAQRRRRYLLVARHPRRCPPVLYQPPLKRVRGCGEVLGELPMPGTPAARAWGRMHELPRLSWLNWVRLSLIPAGGDWRDLEGVLAEGQARREVFKRDAVEQWTEPVGTIAANTGSNGVRNVADPRVAVCDCGHSHDDHGVRNECQECPCAKFEPRRAQWFSGVFGVSGWGDTAPTVTTEANPSNGRYSVADPRLSCAPRAGAYGVQDWAEPSRTVTASLKVDNGPGAVADPRSLQVANENPSAVDPRVKRAFDAGYAVLRWQDAARTIAGISSVGCGAYAVADPRIDEAPPDGGVWTGDPKKAPPFIPVIIAADNTWHRPLTTLELAALQGFPLRVRGEPLKLASDSHTRWRRAIGNAVPAPAARAIGEKMLVALTEGALGAFSLSSEAVWVAPESEIADA